jgi:hypothetical protein
VAAYSLLVELAKNCAENTKLIVDELVPIWRISISAKSFGLILMTEFWTKYYKNYTYNFTVTIMDKTLGIKV